MNKQRLGIIIAATIGMLGTFMPWANVPFLGSVSGTAGDGWITFFLFTIPLVISLIGNKSRPLTGRILYGAIIPGFLCSLLGIYEIINLNSMMAEGGDNAFSQGLAASVSIGFGVYVIILAGIAITVIAFLIKDQTEYQATETQDNTPDTRISEIADKKVKRSGFLRIGLPIIIVIIMIVSAVSYILYNAEQERKREEAQAIEKEKTRIFNLIDKVQENIRKKDFDEALIIANKISWLYEPEQFTQYSEEFSTQRDNYIKIIGDKKKEQKELINAAKYNMSDFYIVNVAAANTEQQAKSKMKELNKEGYNAGYLWIPDYASLSGAQLYCVYIGPFKSQYECEVATEEYRKKDSKAYGLLVSNESTSRVQILGIGKVSKR